MGAEPEEAEEEGRREERDWLTTKGRLMGRGDDDENDPTPSKVVGSGGIILFRARDTVRIQEE